MATFGIISSLGGIGLLMLVVAWRRQLVSIRAEPGPARSNLGPRSARLGQLGSVRPRVARFGSADGSDKYDTQPHSHVAFEP